MDRPSPVPCALAAPDLAEWFEQPRLFLRGDAHAGIGDLPGQHARFTFALYLAHAQYHPAMLGELDRVAEQVAQHLADAVGITEHARGQARIGADQDLQALAGGRCGEAAQHALGQLARRERAGSRLSCPDSILEHPAHR
jgi:hypothetical protein